jgi:hypothetical protein
MTAEVAMAEFVLVEDEELPPFELDELEPPPEPPPQPVKISVPSSAKLNISLVIASPFRFFDIHQQTMVWCLLHQ